MLQYLEDTEAHNARLAYMRTEIQNVTEHGDDDLKAASAVLQILSKGYKDGLLDNLTPLLPYIFKMGGKPFTLSGHYMWEPLFTLTPARSTTVMCGRQVGKSESVAVLMAAWTTLMSHFNTLYVSPRHVQTKTMSLQKIDRFYKDSSFLGALKGDVYNQYHKQFKNGSQQFYSYALLDADRIRSLTANACFIDEAQDIMFDLLPVIFETMSATDEQLRMFTGTPKSFDNNLQIQWESSSQAEWVTPCGNCRYANVANTDNDLLKMIQPQGLSCAKCGKLIDSENGHWEHAIPHRRAVHPGYHAPQVIFPMHFRYDPNKKTHDHVNKINPKWVDIILNQRSVPHWRFMNEKLGESFDNSEDLVKRSSLVESSTLDLDLDFDEAVAWVEDKGYSEVIMGVDWGGGGMDGTSRTTYVIMAGRGANIDVVYMDRIQNALDPADEAIIIARAFKKFKCTKLAHDYCGAGYVRESVLVSAGVPENVLVPMYYVGASTQDVVTYTPPSDHNLRPYLQLSKPRSLMMLTSLLNAHHFRFPRFESWDAIGKEYSLEFLSLVQERRDGRFGETFSVMKKPNRADDMAMSLNYAAWAYWYANGNIPDLSKVLGWKNANS